jgi:hypothetical protein
MNRTTKLLNAYEMQRGLFARVAKKLKFDPSYVSRVAHGERHSKRISVAIREELDRMRGVRGKIT